jgi:hypothetical protein
MVNDNQLIISLVQTSKSRALPGVTICTHPFFCHDVIMRHSFRYSRANQNAFNLVELLAVSASIAVLAAPAQAVSPPSIMRPDLFTALVVGREGRASRPLQPNP